MTSPFAIPVVALRHSHTYANCSFWNQQSLDMFSLVFDLIPSLERAAQEDCQNQQEMMMQMMNQNQQLMMEILAILGNKTKNKNDNSNTKNIEK